MFKLENLKDEWIWITMVTYPDFLINFGINTWTHTINTIIRF